MCNSCTLTHSNYCIIVYPHDGERWWPLLYKSELHAFKFTATSLKLEMRQHTQEVGMNTQSGTEVRLSDWLMRSELGYFERSLISGLNEGAATLTHCSCIHSSIGISISLHVLISVNLVSTHPTRLWTTWRNTARFSWRRSQKKQPTSSKSCAQTTSLLTVSMSFMFDDINRTLGYQVKICHFV